MPNLECISFLRQRRSSDRRKKSREHFHFSSRSLTTHLSPDTCLLRREFLEALTQIGSKFMQSHSADQLRELALVLGSCHHPPPAAPHVFAYAPAGLDWRGRSWAARAPLACELACSQPAPRYGRDRHHHRTMCRVRLAPRKTKVAAYHTSDTMQHHVGWRTASHAQRQSLCSAGTSKSRHMRPCW